jgi:hypothetical protein
MTMTGSEEGGLAVAGLQLDIIWEDPEANFTRVRRMADEAVEGMSGFSEENQRLIVLPEMFATGFSMEAPRVAAHAQITRDFMRPARSRMPIPAQPAIMPRVRSERRRNLKVVTSAMDEMKAG